MCSSELNFILHINYYKNVKSVVECHRKELI